MKERICKFGNNHSLLGITTDPEPDDYDETLPAVILVNAGLLHHVGQNRLNVTLARRLAKKGFLAFRFDFSGQGDSEIQDSSAPVRERSIDEIKQVLDYLQASRNISDFVVIGLCTGADNAHRGAVADKRIRGAVMLDGYSYITYRYLINRFRHKLFSPTHWKNFIKNRISGTFTRKKLTREETAEARANFWILPKRSKAARDYAVLVDREVRLLQVYSGSNLAYNYEKQFADAFKEINFSNLLKVCYIEQADHTYSILEDRNHLISIIVDWLEAGFKSRLTVIPRRSKEREAS